MGRIARWAFLTAFGAAAFAGTAYATEEEDALKDLVADCGGADVKSSDIDSCLERARSMGETSPSPKLQGITARLERMAEKEEEDEDAPAAANAPASSSQSGGGTPVGTGITADKAAPHTKMH
jgi:hypothetical protein